MNYSLFSFALNNTKPIKKEKFLEEMNQAIDWKNLTDLIDKKIQKSQRGRKHLSTEMKLRSLMLQMWYGLSDEAVEDDINDRASFQRFLGLDSANQTAPDSTTLCKFRDFLREEALDEKIFEEIRRILEEKGLLLKKGTAVDATLIAAPSSTKNKPKKRDSQMSSTKKGANYVFGMKVHAGVDIESGIVHSLSVTTAKVHDSREFETLLHGEEGYVTGDRAYDSKENVQSLRARGVRSGIIRKKPKGKEKKLRGSLKKKNKKNSSLRAIGEFPFHTVKHLWKQSKARFKGLKKNESWFRLCFACANVYAVRKKLIAYDAGATG